MTKKIYKFIVKNCDLGPWAQGCQYDIYYNKINVGTAHAPADGKFTVKIKVPASEKALAKNPNCRWMWAKVTTDFETKEAIRNWLNDNATALLEKLYLED